LIIDNDHDFSLSGHRGFGRNSFTVLGHGENYLFIDICQIHQSFPGFVHHMQWMTAMKSDFPYILAGAKRRGMGVLTDGLTIELPGSGLRNSQGTWSWQGFGGRSG
jgi:hypothetical protein